MSYVLVDAELEQRLTSDSIEREHWLLLDKHPEFEGYWKVNAFTKDFKYDLDVGPYNAISPAEYEPFKTQATLKGYEIAFFEDPVSIMEAYEGLNEPPPFSLNSSLENTVGGMLPWQVQGFNYLEDLDAGVARWDTGTGKTVLASGLVKYHRPSFDICFFVVKKNNKVNTARKLRAAAEIESTVIHGNKATRARRYRQIQERLDAGERGIVVVMNYEQFPNDFVLFKKRRSPHGVITVPDALTEWGKWFEGRDVLCIWDEMPMKMKTRTTLRYMAICKCLYETEAPQVNWDKRRPNWLKQYMLSATPIENDPEDWFNCIRLLDPRVFGTVSEFRDEYVASYSPFNEHQPESWRELSRMALKSAHLVHQVDKSDPDVAAVFPDVIMESLYIDWNDEAGVTYKALKKLAKTLDLDEESEGLHVLSLINIFQMICDAPTMVLDSAARRELYESAVETWEETDGDWATEPDRSGSEAVCECDTIVQMEEVMDRKCRECGETGMVVTRKDGVTYQVSLCRDHWADMSRKARAKTGGYNASDDRRVCPHCELPYYHLETGGKPPSQAGSAAALAFVKAIEDKISNVNHAKFEALRGLTTEVHPEEKICVFSSWNETIMPILESAMTEWGIKYVRYDGTDTQKQAAQDTFQTDPEVRVFLSSDMGSDSIDLDAASVVIHYNLPWKWTTYVQRQNRVHRATSKFDTVWYYTLMMADSVEDRKLQIVMQKQGYHDSLFKPIAGASASARMTKEDLRYILGI